MTKLYFRSRYLEKIRGFYDTSTLPLPFHLSFIMRHAFMRSPARNTAFSVALCIENTLLL